jgi:uncharacterized protein YbaP (TraB family)
MGNEKNVEPVEKEMNYVESSFKMRFKSKLGLDEGIQFINDTVNEWNHNGELACRKATIYVNEDELYLSVTMRIESKFDDETEEKDINI